MSLVNISVTPARALIGVDTESRNGETGAFGEVSKMTLLLHCNIVLAGRGVTFLLSTAFSNALMLWPSNFETIEANMSEIIKTSIDYLAANSAQISPVVLEQAAIYDQEIAMVGWSEKRGRMCVLVFQTKGSTDVSMSELEPTDCYLSPWTDEWGEPLDTASPSLMRFAAGLQIEKGRAFDPNAPLGGRLLFCELTKDEARFSSLGVLHTVRGSEAGGQADVSH